MKKLIFILTLSLSLTWFRQGQISAQTDNLFRGDTTCFIGGGGFITIQLILTKNPASFNYLYMDDLWTWVTEGDYLINGDSIYLKCKSDCKDWTGKTFGPIIVEDNSNKEKTGFLFISTLEDTLKNFSAKIITDTSITPSPCSKLIEIKQDNKVVSIQQLRQCDASYFVIYIPFGMLYPNMISFIDKTGFIYNGNIKLDKFFLKYVAIRPKDEKKKRKQIK